MLARDNLGQFIYSLFMLIPTFVLALSQHQTCKIKILIPVVCCNFSTYIQHYYNYIIMYIYVHKKSKICVYSYLTILW